MRVVIQTTLILFAVLIGGVQDASTGTLPPTINTISFRASPKKHVFRQDEDVVLVFSIKNNSSNPIFVSRLNGNEFVDINLLGPDGKEVPWRGTGKIDSKNYSASDFAVLKTNGSVRASRTISLKDGTGFVFQKRGRYSLRAEYSLAPPEYFAPLAGNVKVPAESLRSSKVTFCIETCDADSKE